MPTLTQAPLPQSSYTVTTTAFPGSYFVSFSGLVDTREKSTYQDGLEARTFHLVGNSVLSEMTMEIPFSPEIHRELVLYQRQSRCSRFVVVITPIVCDDDGQVLDTGNALYLTGCQVTSTESYKVDKNTAEAGMLTIKFVADDYYLA